MKYFSLHQSKQTGAYSLSEVLVAAGILMIGVSAAASLTLSMNTQEEIAWRVSRGLNMLENAAAMYQMGLDKEAPLSLIPLDPDVTLEVLDDEADETISGVGVMRGVTYRVQISAVMDAGSWTAGAWTGGSDTVVPIRTVDVRAYRASIDQYNP